MSKKDEHCTYCRENPDVLNRKEGYAVLWPEVKKEIDHLVKKGMGQDLAVTTAINKWIVWVTGSTICKMKSRQFVIKKFWEIYNQSPGNLQLPLKIEWTTKELCQQFRRKYPEAWKCFCGEDYKKKVSGGNHQ